MLHNTKIKELLVHLLHSVNILIILVDLEITLADRNLVASMLKDVQKTCSKIHILLVTIDKDSRSVIQDLRGYGYIVFSAISKEFAEQEATKYVFFLVGYTVLFLVFFIY